MTRAFPVTCKLLVEGEVEKRVIPELMEANGVPWGERGSEVVRIKPTGGFPKMTSTLIATEWKESGLEALGLIADANDDFQSRWTSLRNRCRTIVPGIPDDLARGGVIVTAQNGKRLGIWLMPDNSSKGMFETFLAYLVPNASDGLWRHAEQARDEAKRLGAPYRGHHCAKASMHTWLAWQDPPGRQLHQAIVERILKPQSPESEVFVKWFRSLFVGDSEVKQQRQFFSGGDAFARSPNEP